MTKIKDKYLGLIILGLVFVLWNAIVLILADYEAAKASFWSAFAFIDVAFILSGGLTVFIKINKHSNLAANTPMMIFSSIYFSVSFIFNLIFLLAPSSETITWNLIPNMIFIVFFIISAIIGNRVRSSIEKGEEKVKTKVVALRTLEVKVSSMMYKTQNDLILSALKNLKEKIHYSDPMGIEETAEAEESIKDQLEIIDNLLAIKAEESNIISAIEDAIIKVKIRNDLLGAVR